MQQDSASGTTRTASGLWAAKEAIVKALGNAGLALGAASDPLVDIELCRKENGALGVQFMEKWWKQQRAFRSQRCVSPLAMLTASLMQQQSLHEAAILV